MTTDAQKHPTDHVTARIVTELAAALLPHLKETVSAELTRTIESLPVNVDRQVQEALSSLGRLQTFFEDMTGTLNSAQSAASLLSNELLPLSRTCEILKAAAARLEQLPAEPDTNGAKVNEILLSLEASLSGWGGILRANGHAQTKELSEFSAEVSEQVGWMKSVMPQLVGDILEKKLSPQVEESQTAGEKILALETRLARLEKIAKIILAEGIVFIVLAAALAAALFFRILP